MSAEGNVLMHIMKDEQQPEINLVCEETLTKVEPKCEEELNSCLIKQDLQINEDCDDGHNTLKEEPNDLTTSNQTLSNEIEPFEDDETSTIINTESEISVVTSKIDQPRQLPTEEASVGSKVQSGISTVSFKTLNSGLQEMEYNLQHVSKKFQRFHCLSRRNIINHLKHCHSSKEYKCRQCSFVTKAKDCLLLHMKVKHGSEKFKCHQCSFVTKWKQCLLQHMKVQHGSEQFKCHQCSFVTKWKQYLFLHMKLKHGSDKFKCHQCSFVTKWKQCLLQHMKLKHGSDKFKCHECNFFTKAKEYLVQHMKVKHGSEEFKCQHCNYATNWKHNLLRHIKMHQTILK